MEDTGDEGGVTSEDDAYSAKDRRSEVEDGGGDVGQRSVTTVTKGVERKDRREGGRTYEEALAIERLGVEGSVEGD